MNWISKVARFFLAMMLPVNLWACACGCGIFDVGTRSMFPTHTGGMAFVEYDFMNQNRIWNGTSSAPAEATNDRILRTHYVTAGVQYMVSRRWGWVAELPYWSRHFETVAEDGQNLSTTHSAVGDIRLKGIFTGVSDDMSTGLTLGFKLPSGDYSYSGFDADTQIGTGSTDLLLGSYHRGAITADNSWSWFSSAEWQEPLLHAAGYTPGAEINAAVGGFYDRWGIGRTKIAPLLQLMDSYRWRDSGSRSNSPDTGYERLFISPGLEIDVNVYRLYADVSFPIYQNVYGNQLVALQLYKVNLSCRF